MKTYKYILSFVFLLLITFQSLQAQDQILTLEQAKTLAKTNNKKTKRASQNIAAAEAAKASVYASDKPFIDASALGLHVGEPLSALLPAYNANISLGITQVIYAGGKINTAKKISTTAVDLYTSQKELTEAEVLLDVETTYWQIINTKGKIELSSKYNAMLNQLLKDLNNTYNAGIIYKNDVLRVQVQLNQAQLDLWKAKDALTILNLKMAQLIGSKETEFTIEDAEIEINAIESQLSQENEIANRPEIKMLQKAVSIEELKSKLLEGDRKPTVALNVSGLYGLGKGINFATGDNNFGSYYAMLSVNVPVFDWGGRKQKVKEQDFKVEAQKFELEQTQEFVAIEIANAKLEMLRAKERIEITRKSLAQADENLRLNNDRFDAGTVIGKDVLEAQVLWQTAFSDVIDAKASFKISEANYKKATSSLE
ncbi:TolC family protein [Frigoriflavimonas asaccharolytica]|uniref:Outer membrane protein TolC n=1 Tax=Frigoriflavimonas asaccharolytica TaxID=2735899 RepID=A0A8J8G6N2_9FLAO|nr:TolC family protein [Frigoriflavimonas asaccharolytica]NRS92138.1 outer membrane protein TolC [Frigoriflavimonas asaccharolytica]